MFECGTCNETFYYRDDCDEHMDNYGHWPECETCDRTFRTHQACNQHMDATNQWAAEYPCETCELVFRSEYAADQHMSAKGHWRNYCAGCDRHFDNENNLHMHRNSRNHRGASVTCPLCKTNYTTTSGLSHHLEIGSCANAPRLNRDTILHIIRKRDPTGVITNKQLTWHEGTTATYSVTNQAWNGNCWMCYMCHRGFKTKGALDQHLRLPVHQQKVYRCPNRNCRKEFSALAGMFNHLESETCSFMRFENVQKRVGKVLSGNRLISFG